VLAKGALFLTIIRPEIWKRHILGEQAMGAMTTSTLPLRVLREICFLLRGGAEKRLGISIARKAEAALERSKCWNASTVVGASTATCLESAPL